MCKAPSKTFLYPIRDTHSRRSQVFSVRSVTHLEDTSSSAHTPSTYTFLRDLCKQITAGRKRARVVVLFSFLTSVTVQTSKTLQAQRQTAVVARGDCDALRLIRPLTNHSVCDIYEFIARCNVVVRTYILSNKFYISVVNVPLLLINWCLISVARKLDEHQRCNIRAREGKKERRGFVRNILKDLWKNSSFFSLAFSLASCKN